MKKIILATLLLLSTAVMAQPGPLTPAPVPNRVESTVAPADRAGRSDAADSGAPFAAAPTGTPSQAPTGTRSVPPAIGGGQTPNVSR